MDGSPSTFPLQGILPKEETQAADFVQQNPEWDGRGVVVGIFDTGIDPGALGLQLTPNGKPKIIDLIDCSGSGDVATTTEVEMVDGFLHALSGRKLKLAKVDNPSGKFRLGLKPGYELFPGGLKTRIEKERKERFTLKQRATVTELQRKINEWKEGDEVSKKELEGRLELLTSLDDNDPGPIYDIVLWKDSQNVWRVVVDTQESGDLTNAKVLCDYKIDKQFDNFGKDVCLNYSIKVYEDGNVISIVVESGSHGTHVAGIVGAYFPDQPELNGVAPGVQFVGIKIGDTRLGTMETSTALVRGLIAAKETGCDLVNMSYGEPTRRADIGRFTELLSEYIAKQKLIFVASAGNNGPGLSTVGSPGGCTNGVIGVGAMVSPQMMTVLYSMRQVSESANYTWSSRGPSERGALGVSVSAPGGAYSNVPNWTLDKNQLMNGTSMSSPNCCGCIALVLSGLKAKQIDYSPASIKTAIENTAKFNPVHDKLTQGHGTVQVVDAFTHASKFSTEHFVTYAANVNGDPGLFLTERADLLTETSYTVMVTPQFNEETDNQTKINFEKRFNLCSTASWLKTPKHFLLSASTRQFKVEADLPSLKPGAYYYAEIQGWDSAAPNEKGPAFRFPVTVISPEQLGQNEYSRTFKDLKFKPGVIHRFFCTVPKYASWCNVKIRCGGLTSKRLFTYVNRQYIKHRGLKEIMNDEIVWLNTDSKPKIRFSVVENKTLEFDLGTYWSQAGDEGTVDVEIKFHSLRWETIDSHASLPLTHGTFLETRVSAPLGPEKVKYQAHLCVSQTKVNPTASNIVPLGERDLLTDQRQISRLTNTYTFTDEGTVRLLFPLYSDLLYDSPIEGPLSMIYDENKKLVKTLDFRPLAFALPRRGTYTVLVQFRHNEISKLKGLRTLPMIIEKHLPKDKQIALSLYPSAQAAISQGTKLPSGSQPLRAGGEQIAIIAAPEQDKIPQGLVNGDTLFGYFCCRDPKAGETVPDAVSSNGLVIPKGAFPISYVVSAPKAQPPAPPQQFSIIDNKKSVEDNFSEARKKFILNYVEILIRGKQLSHLEILLPQFMKEYPAYLPLYKANLQFRVGQVIENSVKEHSGIIEAADELRASIDVNSIALFFGIKHDENEEKLLIQDFTNQKETLIHALWVKANSLCEIQKKEPNDNIKKSIKETLAEMSKWVNIAEDSKYASLYITSQLLDQNLSSASKAIKKALTTSNDKQIREQEIQILRGLGWDHWVAQKEARLVVDFPKSYQLF